MFHTLHSRVKATTRNLEFIGSNGSSHIHLMPLGRELITVINLCEENKGKEKEKG